MWPRKNNPKQPRNPKNGSGKRYRAYKIPFRKDMRIKNWQRGYLVRQQYEILKPEFQTAQIGFLEISRSGKIG
jgi:hypothetical protein